MTSVCSLIGIVGSEKFPSPVCPPITYDFSSYCLLRLLFSFYHFPSQIPAIWEFLHSNVAETFALLYTYLWLTNCRFLITVCALLNFDIIKWQLGACIASVFVIVTLYRWPLCKQFTCSVTGVCLSRIPISRHNELNHDSVGNKTPLNSYLILCSCQLTAPFLFQKWKSYFQRRKTRK